MRTLYVIGNGFDLRHGLPSSYGCFKCYLNRGGRSDDVLLLDYLFGENKLWSDYENALGLLSPSQFEKFIQWYKEYDRKRGVPGPYAVENGVDTIYSTIETDFREWIYSLTIDAIEPKMNIDTDALFLTFNYTETLEQVYGLPHKHILYIHNNLNQGQLVYGHGLDNVAIEEMGSHFENEDMKKEFVALMQSFKKNTSDIIDGKKRCFAMLNDVSKVIVIGHSLNEIDMPYFECIQAHIPSQTPWEISTYKEYCVSIYKKRWRLCRHGIKIVSFFDISHYDLHT